MRKLFLLIACLCFVLTSTNAQHQVIKATPATITYHSPASKAAALDPSIQAHINSQTNTTYYLRKNVCEETGKVTYDTLEYCSRSKKFIKVTPVKEVRSSCSRQKGTHSTQMIKAPTVTQRANFEYQKAQKAACSSATNKVKGKVQLVKGSGQ